MFSILTVAFRMSKIVFYLNKHLSVTILSYFAFIFNNVKVSALYSNTYFVTFVSVEGMIDACFHFHVSRIIRCYRITLCAFVITVIMFLIQVPLYGLVYLHIYTVDNETEYRRIIIFIITEF